MRSFAALVSRMSRPLSTAADVPGWVQLAGSALTLVAGGGIAGVAFSPAAGVGVVLTLLLGLAFIAAFNLQRELERQKSHRPNLVLGDPKTRAAFGFRTDELKGLSVDVPISNHPQPNAELGVAAENLHARLRVVPDEDGTPGSHWVEALWLQRQQAGNRFVGSVDENAEPEIQLPPNGRPFDLATVMQLPGNEFCSILTQADYWDIGVTWPFVVEVEIQGSNVPACRFKMRVTPSKSPVAGTPKAELLEALGTLSI